MKSNGVAVEVLLCVREFRQKVFLESKQALTSHVPATTMTFADAQSYCRELRSDCPFENCSDNWDLVLPYNSEEMEYFLKLSSLFWTSHGVAGFENSNFDGITDINGHQDVQKPVYATVSLEDQDSIELFRAIDDDLELPVICVDYKFGFVYNDLDLVGATTRLFEFTSGEVRLLITVGNELAKNSAVRCKAIHQAATLVDLTTKQDYYDFVNFIPIIGVHILEDSKGKNVPYLENIENTSFPVIQFPDITSTFVTKPSFAFFASPDDQVWLDCSITLYKNWKELEFGDSKIEYNLQNLPRQVEPRYQLSNCEAMGGEMASLQSTTDIEIFAALMASSEIDSLFFASGVYNQTLIDCQTGCTSLEHSLKGIGFDALVN